MILLQAAPELFLSLVPFLFMLMFFAFGAGLFALWIWMLVDCIQNETDEGNMKLIWLLVIILTGWIGALLYFFIQRPKRIREQKQNQSFR